jgi:hypothetical protein
VRGRLWLEELGVRAAAAAQVIPPSPVLLWQVLTAARAKSSDAAGGAMPAMFGAPASATGTNNYPLGAASQIQQQPVSAAPAGVPSRLVVLEHMVSAHELEVRGWAIWAF